MPNQAARRDATAASSVVAPPKIPTTLTTLTSEVAGIRDNARFLHDDAQELHHDLQLRDLDARTALKAREAVRDLLQALADRGFAWSTIAGLVGVSVPALRKWRGGEGVSGDNRREVARLAALCEWLDEYFIADVASWFEVPLADAVRVTPETLYRAGRLDLVLDYAAQRMTPEQVLDEFDPSWRDSSSTKFEVFEAGDGSLSLRKKM